MAVSRSLMEIPLSGSSMFPCLKEGDVLFVQETDYELEIGNLYLFKDQEQKLVCHRLIDQQNFFKGDNEIHGESVGVEKIIGKLIKVKRGEDFITIQFEPGIKLSFICFLSRVGTSSYGPIRRFSRSILKLLAAT